MSDKKRILIVEDDQYIRDVYEEVLKEEGYELKTAVDGQDGVHVAREGGFDLILLDMMMPKLDGLGVLKELKQTPPKTKNGPIILLTNLAHESVIKEAESLGATGYLVKSDLNPEELIQKIKGFFK